MLKVTCAIIIYKGKVLITQHSVDSKYPLKWEFPGGKIEKDESASECIKREIKEELGLEIEIWQKLNSVVYQLDVKKLELIPFLCTVKEDKIFLNEHADYKWLDLAQLKNFDLLAADELLIEMESNKKILTQYIGKNKNKT